jgi:hypothetical protein
MQPRVELIDGIGLADAPSGTAKMHVSFSFAASLIYFFRIQRRSFRLILVPGNSAAAKHHVYCFLSSTSSSRSATSVNQRPPPQVQHRRRPSELLQIYNTAMMTSKLNNLYVHFYSRSLSVFALGRCVIARIGNTLYIAIYIRPGSIGKPHLPLSYFVESCAYTVEEFQTIDVQCLPVVAGHGLQL